MIDIFDNVEDLFQEFREDYSHLEIFKIHFIFIYLQIARSNPRLANDGQIGLDVFSSIHWHEVHRTENKFPFFLQKLEKKDLTITKSHHAFQWHFHFLLVYVNLKKKERRSLWWNFNELISTINILCNDIKSFSFLVKSLFSLS